MPRRYWFLLVGLAVFFAAFLMVAFRRQAPVIPGDEVHRSLPAYGAACMACHGPGQARPRSKNHPFGEDCASCHSRAGEPGQ